MVNEIKKNRINNIIDNYLSNMIYEKITIHPSYVDYYYHSECISHYSLFVNNKDKRITIITSLLIETYSTYENCPISRLINDKFGTDNYEVRFIEEYVYGEEFW